MLEATVTAVVNVDQSNTPLFCQSFNIKLIERLADLGSWPNVSSPPIISIASCITSSISKLKL